MSRPSALVTGASRGIGEAVAERLASDGYDLTLSARSEAPLVDLARRLESEHRVAVRAKPADMSDEDDVLALATFHAEASDRLDALVLNAGMGSIGQLADFPVRRLDKLMTVNFRSAFVLTQSLLPLLRRAGATAPGGGRVIAVASATGVVGVPLNSAYGATKAALISWCETLSTEESINGVSATAICPGYVATDMTKGLSEHVSPEEMIPISDVVELVAATARLSRRTVVPQVVMLRPGRYLWQA